MTVNGTEQRVYGTLIGECKIALDRFAIVLNSTTQDPTESSTVVYGSSLTLLQCGYLYDGYISLLRFLPSNALNPSAAFEIYICKRDSKRMIIETYGDLNSDVDISLWFNQARSLSSTGDDIPVFDDTKDQWIKLNSTTESTTMTYVKETFIFSTSADKSGATEILCCQHCVKCGCLECGRPDVYVKVYENGGAYYYTTSHTYKSSRVSRIDNSYQVMGVYTPIEWDEYWNIPIYIHYKFDCDSITMLTYYSSESFNAPFTTFYGYEVYYDDPETGIQHLLGEIPYNTVVDDGKGSTFPNLRWIDVQLGGPDTFNFDYLLHCVTLSPIKVCCNYLNISASTNIMTCKDYLIGKHVQFYYGYPGSPIPLQHAEIEEVISSEWIKLKSPVLDASLSYLPNLPNYTLGIMSGSSTGNYNSGVIILGTCDNGSRISGGIIPSVKLHIEYAITTNPGNGVTINQVILSAGSVYGGGNHPLASHTGSSGSGIWEGYYDSWFYDANTIAGVWAYINATYDYSVEITPSTVTLVVNSAYFINCRGEQLTENNCLVDIGEEMIRHNITIF